MRRIHHRTSISPDRVPWRRRIAEAGTGGASRRDGSGGLGARRGRGAAGAGVRLRCVRLGIVMHILSKSFGLLITRPAC